MTKKLGILVVEDNPGFVKAFETNKGIVLDKFGKYGVNEIMLSTNYEHYKKQEGKANLIVTDMFIPYSDDTKESKEKGIEFYRKFFKEVILNRYRYSVFDHEEWAKDLNCSIKVENVLKALTMLEKRDYNSFYEIGLGFSVGSGRRDALQLKIAPYGMDIFEENYYKKERPIIMATNSHAHGDIGSVVFAMMQSKYKEDSRGIPFYYIRGSDDIRLLADFEKSRSPRFLAVLIEHALVINELYEKGFRYQDLSRLSKLSSHIRDTDPNLLNKMILKESRAQIFKDYKCKFKDKKDKDIKQVKGEKEYYNTQQITQRIEEWKTREIQINELYEILFSNKKQLLDKVKLLS